MFWGTSQQFAQSQTQIYLSQKSGLHVGPPAARARCLLWDRGDTAVVREQLPVFPDWCVGHLGAWPCVITFSRTAWIMAELSSQGCSVLYRLYLRCINYHLSIMLRNSCDHVVLRCFLPELFFTWVVSLSVRYLAPSPHVHCNLFLSICFQQWDLPSSLDISYDAPFHTKHPSASSWGSSPGTSLLCSLVYPNNTTRNLRRKNWLQCCILKISFTLGFTCGERYFHCVLPLCPAILPFPLDITEVT